MLSARRALQFAGLVFEHTLEDVKNKFDIRTGMVIPENGVKLSRRHIYVFSSWPGKSRETV